MESIDSVGSLAALSAAIHVFGYGLYIRHALRRDTRPNAASSFMFAYGTVLLVLLERQSGASWTILLLPAMCALLGLVVALLCLRQEATERIDRIEAFAFAADLVLTVVYLAVWLLGQLGAVTSVTQSTLGVLLLLFANATTLTAFAPVVRSTFHTPDRERALPWVVWTGGYTLLLIVTLAGDWRQSPALLVYPTLNIFLHALVAFLAARPRLSAMLAAWASSRG